MTNQKALSLPLPLPLPLLLLPLAALFLLNSAAKDAPGVAPKPYQVMKEFCRQKPERVDTGFCLTALKSDPRSARAKNTTDLLHISVDLAVRRANKTREYLAAFSKKGPKPPLKVALEECVSAYDQGLLELNIIPEELLGDPGLASYDALLASDALLCCKQSLERNRVYDRSISTRHRVSTAYVDLCVAIAMTVN